MVKDRLSPQLLQLIDSINQKARSAHVSAAGFHLIGLLLLAFAFSTSDLNLTRNTTEPPGALNVPIQVIGGFALSPFVFFAMLGFTLIRDDMLGQDLETYRDRIGRVAGDDAAMRDWYRHLIANIEFAQVVVLQTTVLGRTDQHSEPGRRPRDRLLYLAARLSMVIIPLLTLAVIEISALHLQSPVINWTQKGAIAAETVLLLWCFPRNLGRVRPQQQRDDPLTTTSPARRVWIRALRSPPSIALQRMIERAQPHERVARAVPSAEKSFLQKLVSDPKSFWHATSRMALALVAPDPVFWSGTIPGAAEAGPPGAAAANTVLLGRACRDNSVRATPLTWQTILSGLRHLVRQPLDLVFCPETHWGYRYLTIGHKTLDATAKGTPIDLSARNLRYADFGNADVKGINFWGSDLADATFAYATLDNADFDRATLDRARSSHAHLTGAKLDNADLAGAYMLGARLWGADPRGTTLLAADLTNATLDGTLLTNADLHLADLSGARFYGAETDDKTMLSYADAGGVDMITPLPIATARTIAAVQTYPDFKSLVAARLHRAETVPARHRTMVFTAAPGSIFVETWPEPAFPSLQAACVVPAPAQTAAHPAADPPAPATKAGSRTASTEHG